MTPKIQFVVLDCEIHLIYANLKHYFSKFKGERFVGIYRLLTPQLMILDTDLCKEIFVKNFRSFHDTSFAKMVNGEADPLLAFNPFFLAGEEWKNKRSEITPAFSPARVCHNLDFCCHSFTYHQLKFR